MGNHYHLLVQTPQGNLVAGMTWLQSTYTARFNARHQQRGQERGQSADWPLILPVGKLSAQGSLSARFDASDNAHGSLSFTLYLAEPFGGNRVGGTLAGNLYGSGITGEYTTDMKVKLSPSASAVIYLGASAGVSW